MNVMKKQSLDGTNMKASDTQFLDFYTTLFFVMGGVSLTYSIWVNASIKGNYNLREYFFVRWDNKNGGFELLFII